MFKREICVSPRWFNKPKFHVLLHLPDHIRRFGPAMLFATESFESYNALIRSRSVHSNRHAPSKDIAHAMARSNRVRHLLNGGVFWTKLNQQKLTQIHTPVLNKTIYEQLSENPLHFTDPLFWKSASKDALALLTILSFDIKLLGRGNDMDNESSGMLTYGGPPTGSVTGMLMAAAPLSQSIFAMKNPFQNELDLSLSYRTYNSIVLQSGDQAFECSWIVWNRSIGNSRFIPTVGLIIEIGQVVRSHAENKGMASFVTVRRAITGEWHHRYGMRQIELTTEHQLVYPQDIQCVVNIQHNCSDNKCPVKRTAVVIKEREASKEKELRVEHLNTSSLVLNTAQMRSAAYLKAFRRPITPLNREQIISEAARKEIDARKQKAKVDLAGSKASALPKKTVAAVTPQNRLPSSLRPHITTSNAMLAQPSTSLSHAQMFPGSLFAEQQTHPDTRYGSGSHLPAPYSSISTSDPHSMYHTRVNPYPFYNTYSTVDYSSEPHSLSTSSPRLHNAPYNSPPSEQNSQLFPRNPMYPYRNT